MERAKRTEAPLPYAVTLPSFPSADCDIKCRFGDIFLQVLTRVTLPQAPLGRPPPTLPLLEVFPQPQLWACGLVHGEQG